MLTTRLTDYATASGASVAFVLSADLDRKVIAVLAASTCRKRQMPGMEVDAGTCKLMPGLELSNILGEFDATKEHIMLAYLSDVVGVGER
jgi:hypothetical protein